MFSGRSAALILTSPADNRYTILGEPTEHAIVDLLDHCFAKDVGPVSGQLYGASLQNVWDGLASLDARGIYNDVYLDHLQACGPAEDKVIKADQAAHPAPWREQRYLIGNVHGAIAHGKLLVFNAPIRGYNPPPQDYPDVFAALDEGYPVSWFGSWNMSPGADKQFNYAALLPGVVLATMFCEAIAAVRAYTVAHQQQYQPWPLQNAPQ